MLVWYWLENKNILNFGEHITPYILNHFGVEWKNYSERTEEDKELLLMIGSELNKERLNQFRNVGIEKFHIWGQGKGHGTAFDYNDYDITFHMVRGEGTKKELNLPEEIPTGDPAFIMPFICPAKRQNAYGIVYAPHHVNREHLMAKSKTLGFTDYFDVMIHRPFFIDRLTRLINSEFVITNSLHVSIICLAYGVPFCVSVLSDEHFNFPPKWKDVFEWAGINFSICNNLKDGKEWWSEEVEDKVLPDARKIINSFPKNIF